MYIGHYAIAFAAKKAAPKTSLGTLIAAAQMIDLIWPLLVLAGIEKVAIDPGNTVVTPLNFAEYPFSHSLLAVMGWASLFAGIYWMITHYRAGTVTIWFAVVSHWVLDLITHRPDLPLFPGGDKLLGLGLWNSLTATLLFEVGLFAVGIYIYFRMTKAVDRTGKVAFWALIVFLVATYAMNIFGPAPPAGGERVVAFSALLLWLLVPWGYWIDRHRATVSF